MTAARHLAAFFFALALYLAIHVCIPTSVYAQGTVSGTVLNSRNVPIPGLMVSLVHPIVGRSHPSFTDPLGRFVFFNVPIVSNPYYLEVYWGRDLLYRRALLVNAPSVPVSTIVLR